MTRTLHRLCEFKRSQLHNIAVIEGQLMELKDKYLDFSFQKDDRAPQTDSGGTKQSSTEACQL
jgi:hypothetical protein